MTKNDPGPRHELYAFDGDDGGDVRCRGCDARGSYDEPPSGKCPTPYRSDRQLLDEALAREAALRAELAELRQDALRYRWLRERSVRLQGSDMWWQGAYLDVRVDTGLGHIQGEFTVEPDPPRASHQTPKITTGKEPHPCPRPPPRSMPPRRR